MSESNITPGTSIKDQLMVILLNTVRKEEIKVLLSVLYILKTLSRELKPNQAKLQFIAKAFVILGYIESVLASPKHYFHQP